MNKEFSLYLDGVRITAALVVFLGHASGPLTDGFLWQLNDYLDAAVMVFFVLSGYVIAFVSNTKEKTLRAYSVSRISRLSSVVIPALILTFICDQIGLWINADLYYNGPWNAPNNEFINYFLSLFLLQNIWHLNLQPGMNSPFWSLSYELMFYIIFAASFYFQGKKRLILILISILVAGPDILLSFPLWLMGASSYYLHQRESAKRILNSNIALCSIFSICSLLALIVCAPWAEKNMVYDIPLLPGSRKLAANYLYSILFTVHLLTIPPLLHKLKTFLFYFAKPITLLGSMTFSLYLFHRPLIQVFATFSNDPSSPINRATIIFGTILVTATLGLWCEKNKYTVKQYINKHL